MPTYEYECKKCGLLFEEYQSITAPPLTTCKKEGCGGEVRRLISSGGGFIFKGSGFYQTDYRSDSYTRAAKSAGEAPSTPAAAPAAPSAKPSESGSSSAASGAKT
jgi:putative FmdB family regulatory protein